MADSSPGVLPAENWSLYLAEDQGGYDLRPAPRLPLDTTVVTVVTVGELGTVISSDPAEGGVSQISLLQTQTPTYWPSAIDRAVYSKEIAGTFDTITNAALAATPVLEEFAKDNPKPPQNRGTNS